MKLWNIVLENEHQRCLELFDGFENKSGDNSEEIFRWQKWESKQELITQGVAALWEAPLSISGSPLTLFCPLRFLAFYLSGAMNLSYVLLVRFPYRLDLQ